MLRRHPSSEPLAAARESAAQAREFIAPHLDSAREALSPHVAAAWDALGPHVEQAMTTVEPYVEQVRTALGPHLTQARVALAPRAEQAREIFNDDVAPAATAALGTAAAYTLAAASDARDVVGPRLEAALSQAATNAAPLRDEALRRSSDAIAALRGDPPASHGRHWGMGLLLLAAGAGAGMAAGLLARREPAAPEATRFVSTPPQPPIASAGPLEPGPMPTFDPPATPTTAQDGEKRDDTGGPA